MDSEGKALPVQVHSYTLLLVTVYIHKSKVAPVSDSTNVVRRDLSSAPYDVVVSLMSSPIPALGYRVYTVRPNTKG